MDDLSVGDIVSITIKGNHDKPRYIVIVGDKYSMCNSDGEEWWVEWKGKELETDRFVNVSSRFHKISKI
jgi:hypothetical protein